MNENIQLQDHERLLLLCSRIEMTVENEEEAKVIIDKGFDIDTLVSLANRHKVLQLIGGHLLRLDQTGKIKNMYKRLFNSYYISNKHRNELMFAEGLQVLQAFDQESIKAIPLKGFVLLPKVYKDMGLRICNDLDFLIDLSDRNKVSQVLKSLGYVIGDYDWSSNTINQVSRQEEMLWKMHIGNIYPHVKLSEDPLVRHIDIDFSYDVDLKKNYQASKELLENAVQTNLEDTPAYLLEEMDFLIHIAIHLYKEATNVQWVLLHADLNLIKFCDLRECTLNLLESGRLDWNLLAKRAKDLLATEALFYSFYYLDYLYDEHYSDELQPILNIRDETFLEKYGELDYGSAVKWKKSFVERFFSLSNADELEGTSRLEQFKEKMT
ncbi:nucleotidyltransferase family protein [Paenibacillus xylanilyticus]|uniref:nucleotidyltransferase domain-containing protein n=1 Tax=Paenibacillus xylanilyticus TaxID=248903 RepID=UPI0039A11F23